MNSNTVKQKKKNIPHTNILGPLSLYRTKATTAFIELQLLFDNI